MPAPNLHIPTMRKSMIISISRRTDIPAYYSPWLFHRLREGYAVARNPRNPRQERRVSLKPEDVDAIVFWSKNPAPMLPRLQELAGYRFYFQFTLTGYDPEIEPAFADRAALLDTFRQLSDAIGPARVLWRYDPILRNPDYTPERHAELFGRLAHTLRGYTKRCTISFIDDYKNTAANAAKLRLAPMDDGVKTTIAATLAPIARECGIDIMTCAEGIDLTALGIGHGRCVDAGLINGLWGLALPATKDKSQRPGCLCAPSVDLGVYNTCPGGCLYCYANYNTAVIERNREGHDPAGSAFLQMKDRF